MKFSPPILITNEKNKQNILKNRIKNVKKQITHFIVITTDGENVGIDIKCLSCKHLIRSSLLVGPLYRCRPFSFPSRV